MFNIKAKIKFSNKIMYKFIKINLNYIIYKLTIFIFIFNKIYKLNFC